MLRAALLGCLLLVALLPRPAAAEEPADRDARLGREVVSVAAVTRARAVAEARTLGLEGRTLARRWAAADDVRARIAGWQVLSHVGGGDDLRSAALHLGDAQPAVAVEAARALVALGGRLAPAAEPWLPRAAAPERGQRPFAHALIAAMEAGPRDGVPDVLLALGEGAVPTLVYILADPRFGTGARAGALRALAAIGGTEARAAIAGLVTELEPERFHPLWSAWWRALNAVGSGAGLAPAHSLVVRYAQAIDFNPWRGPMRRLHWRDRQQYFQFLAQSPPAEGAAYVREYLEWLIEQASENARRRLFPTLAATIIRAYLVVCEPTEETLRQAVLCAQAHSRRHWQRRAEELGEVLALLAPYRDRPGVQAGLDALLAEDDIPKTVRAWALHLKAETPHAEMVAIAEALIDADGGAATLAQRRLGARLLGRLGLPSEARIRRTAAELDGSLHALGIDWAVRAAVDGRFPKAEAEALVAAALGAEDDGVFLVAAERRPELLDEDGRARLLRLGVRGSPGMRGRVWRVVGRVLQGEDEATPAFVAPPGHAALDARLAAASRARAAWQR